MILTVKIDPALHRAVTRAAAQSGVSRSEYVRRALRSAALEPDDSYRHVKDIIGKYLAENPGASERSPRDAMRHRHARRAS